MPFSKRLFTHPFTQAILAFLLSLVIRLVYITNRKSFLYDAQAMPYMRGEQNAIFAFWHGRLMMCPAISPKSRTMWALISHHRDGMLISSVIRYLGQRTINGSSSRGGSAAVKDLLRALKAGDNVCITPDGPRGPHQEAAMGIVSVARLSGKPILPVTFSASHHVRLNSWDRFMLALPFGRIVFCVGAPVMIEGEEDESSRLKLESIMNALVDTADGAAHG